MLGLDQGVIPHGKDISNDRRFRQAIYTSAACFLRGIGATRSQRQCECLAQGLDTLRILGAVTVAYLDLTGSGIETVAHLKENGRIVLMFCSFQGPPRILRLYGRGHVVEPQQGDFPDLAPHFPEYEATRAIVVIEVSRIADSCGYGVPLLRYEGERDQLSAWARNRGPEGLKNYRVEKNQRSIDGLPGLNTTAESVKR
jgi:hypothetical protein